MPQPPVPIHTQNMCYKPSDTFQTTYKIVCVPSTRALSIHRSLLGSGTMNAIIPLCTSRRWLARSLDAAIVLSPTVVAWGSTDWQPGAAITGLGKAQCGGLPASLLEDLVLPCVSVWDHSNFMPNSLEVLCPRHGSGTLDLHFTQFLEVLVFIAVGIRPPPILTFSLHGTQGRRWLSFK